MPGTCELDDRTYVIVASSPNWDRAFALAEEVRKRIYGYDVTDWVDHLEDVMAYCGHTHLILVDQTTWAAYQDKEMLLMYCQGYTDAE
jgi:hypothetical protein